MEAATTEDCAAVHAVAFLLWNSAPLRLAERLFPNSHPNYQAEWADRLQKGFTAATGMMDTDTFRRFVNIAMDEYGEEARARYREVAHA